jgi:hypothetical protein
MASKTAVCMTEAPCRTSVRWGYQQQEARLVDISVERVSGGLMSAERDTRSPHPQTSDSVQVGDRPVILDVARVQSGLGLEHQQVRLFLGDGEMFNASGNDDELALFQPNVAIAQPDQQSSLYDEEQLVFRIVMVPDELTLTFTSLTYER